MFRDDRPAEVRHTDRLPPEYQRSQVDALFSDATSLVIGSVAAFVSVFAVALRTGYPTIYGIAVLVAVLSGIRLWTMKRYARRRGTLSPSDLGRWELAYDIGAASHVGLLGAFCFATFALSHDDVARLLSFATALAYLSGIPGRNFASASGVDLQVATGAIPVVGAMMVAGSRYWLIVVIVLVPFFMALRGMASRLRAVFIQAVTKASDLSHLASRFDTALSNMPHGLAMFDSGGVVEICNERFLDLLGLDPATEVRGQPIMGLLTAALPAVSERELRLSAIETQLTRPSSVPLGLTKENGVCLEFTFQDKPSGGAVALVQDVTERKLAEARIVQLALFDELTDLSNRTQFGTTLETILAGLEESGATYGLLFIDLDEFKQVNDTLGHSCGDKLLRQVADRLRAAAVPGDAIARFGGDEFVMLHRIGHGRSPEELSERLIEDISKPYTVDGMNVIVGASIGFALIPEHGTTSEQLLRKADMALYCAKGERRGCFRIFEPRMDEQARARSELENDLRMALERDEFELFYQPIYSLARERFSVCEALLRWRHPTRGLVSPAEFIPVVEEMGLIVKIGEWVLRQACLACAKWPCDMRVAVNISSLQFRSSDLVPSVTGALADARLPPQRLELELTESVLLQDLPLTRMIMQQLHGLQVGIALDDFGTGYSSLSYLHSLPLSKVKMDRSFLRGLGTSDKTLLMLKGIARLSSELGLTVVIEGVETSEQLITLADQTRIDEVQGFLFSRPVPEGDLAPFLFGVKPAAAIAVARAA